MQAAILLAILGMLAYVVYVLMRLDGQLDSLRETAKKQAIASTGLSVVLGTVADKLGCGAEATARLMWLMEMEMEQQQQQPEELWEGEQQLRHEQALPQAN